MNNINCLIIEGDVCNVSFTELPNGIAKAIMKIGVNHTYKVPNKDEYIDEVSYFYIISLGELAKCCKKYGTKGKTASVVGRLKEQDNVTSIIAEKIEFKVR